jgi:hypothetical protein
VRKGRRKLTISNRLERGRGERVEEEDENET